MADLARKLPANLMPWPPRPASLNLAFMVPRFLPVAVKSIKSLAKDKDEKLLFQSGRIENCELCTGISYNPKY
jgi:hypothetical protein